MGNDLRAFVDTLDHALNAALESGCDADDLEMVLQKRAQDMREVAAQDTEE